MLTPISVPVQSQRYYALDALRASMMLLGLVFHSAVSYMQRPLKVWPLQDSATSHGFDVLCYFIHLFRMPVFFVAAGFFAALLYQKRGPAAMLKNRTGRVLLPLLLFFVVLMPPFKMSYAFAMKGGGAAGWAAAVDMLTSLSAFSNLHLAHLWFLYYLMLLYVAALLLLPLLRRIEATIPTALRRATMPYLVHGKALPVLILLTFLTLLPMGEVGLDTSVSWIPAPHVLAAYGVFFAYGWLVYGHKWRLAYLRHYWAVCFACGVAVVAFQLFVLPGVVPNPAQAVLWGKALAAMALWLLIYASLGLFQRYFDQPSPIIRYLSDASYWMYLIHLPVVVMLVGVLAGLALPGAVKFTIVVTGTGVFSLLTYSLFVRATVIGALLNGRKYPRNLPQPSRQSMEVVV